MDKVILNLISLLVAGTGIFSALTKFYVPELDATFLGHNPFSIKANTIDDVTTKLFVGLGIVGLFLQAIAIIFDDQLPKALHTSCFYVIVFLVGLCLSFVCILGVKNIGYCISKRIWVPKVIQRQEHLYSQASFIIEHGGWREEQLEIKDQLSDPEQDRQNNLKRVEEHLSEIERLLDIKNGQNDLEKRIKYLERYFKR